MVNKKRDGRKMFSFEKKSLFWGVLIIILLAILFAVFSFSTSSTEGVTKVTGNALFNDGFDGLGSFKFFNSDGISEQVVKFIMLFIVLMAVYWAIDFLIEGKTIGKLIFSGAIAYLSVNFIVIDEIYSIMTTYSALGVTFTVIVPFIIILLFTSRLVSEDLLKVSSILVEKIIWFAYFTFLVYYLLSNRGVFGQSNTFMNWLILLLAIISLLIVVFNKKFIRWMRELLEVTRRLNAQTRMHNATTAEAESRHKGELRKIVEDLKAQERLNQKLRDDMNRLSS